MSFPTYAPGGHSPAHGVGSDEVAAAIIRELNSLFPGLTISRLTRREGTDDAEPAQANPSEIRVISAHPPEAGGHSPAHVLVSGTAARPAGSVVVAAVDDDANPGHILRHAAAEARRLRVPLRVVHVCTEWDTSAPGQRMSRHDRMSDADRLLSAVLYDHLTPAEAEATEREILHDRDVVSALIALSADASLVVIAARSGPTAHDEPLGDTVRALIGRTGCPVAVLPPCAEMVTTASSW
jgi:nucleotide-binding universal stress UspA family protein